ncbi:C1 family peptidase [Bradyrhizobium sp. USDA 4502]
MSARSPSRRKVLTGLAASILTAPALAQQRPVAARYPRGAQVPPRIKALIQAQTEAAQSLNRLLATSPEFLKTKPRLAQSPARLESRWDWREQGCVTPVKNQGSCGSCWAFAAAAAFESSYAITNNKQMIDISEQELLDCTFGDVNCVGGGWHQAAFMYLQYAGLVDSYRYYYTAAKGACTANFQRTYFALNWGYVGEQDNRVPQLIPSDQALKTAIRQYGPLATGVGTRYWESYWKTSEAGAENPSWYTDFPKGVFQGTRSDNDPNNVDHEVTMIGWDDGLGAWILKNSWGTSWGDGGYMLLPYGCNNIGFGASWVATYPSSLPGLADSLQLSGPAQESVPPPR